MTLEQQRRTTWLGLFALGAIAGAFIGLRYAGVDFPRWSRIALLAVVFPLAGYMTLRWWRLLDEVAREAHKFAWYWGGSGGALVSGLAMALVARDTIPIPFAMGSDPADLYAAGIATAFMAQVMGYLIAWAGWWWARR